MSTASYASSASVSPRAAALGNTSTSNVAPSVNYAPPPVLLASQFLVGAGTEHVLVECSAGCSPWHTAQADELPVHTRLALTWPAVQRLHDLLGQALVAHESLAAVESTRAAQWPRFEG